MSDTRQTTSGKSAQTPDDAQLQKELDEAMGGADMNELMDAGAPAEEAAQ